jgi:hypothetical protein
MAQSPQWNAWVKDLTARDKYEGYLMDETTDILNGKAYWKDTYDPDHMGEEGEWAILTKDNKVLLFYYYDDWESTTTLMRKTFTIDNKPKSKTKKKTGRKAPTISATRRKIGTRMRGNDGNMWEVKRSGKSQRWIRGAEDTRWSNFGYRSTATTKGNDNLTIPFDELTEEGVEEEKSHHRAILIGVLCGSALMAFISSKLK